MTSAQSVTGDGLVIAKRLGIIEGSGMSPREKSPRWVLRGVVSHERYAMRVEQQQLLALSPPLGRSVATRAALIPITKSEAWWALAQDERRRIFEERSHHIELGTQYLPRIARRLFHSRDLQEPFDFLTWFEFGVDDEPAFDELIRALRQTEEWTYVVREIDIRLTRNSALVP